MRAAVWLAYHARGEARRASHGAETSRVHFRVYRCVVRAIRRVGQALQHAGDSCGALSLPLVLCLVAVSLMSFGTWGLLRHWRHLTELQIRLDRCVGQAALDLASTQGRIERSNQRLRELRAAAAAALLAEQPPGEFKPAMDAVVTYQKAELFGWNARHATWIAWIEARGCGPGLAAAARSVRIPTLPELHWSRPPDDLLGPLPLRWEEGASKTLLIRLAHSPRAAAAIVEARARPGGAASGLAIQVEGALFGGETWKSRWVPPAMGGPLGAVVD